MNDTYVPRAEGSSDKFTSNNQRMNIVNIEPGFMCHLTRGPSPTGTLAVLLPYRQRGLWGGMWKPFELNETQGA